MKTLAALIQTTIDRPVEPAIAHMADHLRQSWPGKISAVLGYGSAFRGTDIANTLMDYYLLTEDEHAVSSSFAARMACRLVPPNVYYAESPFEGAVLRAKFAVVSLPQFAKRMTPANANPYFWARFCQPVRLIYSKDGATRSTVVTALCTAAQTMYGNARTLATASDPLAIFQAGFEATYRTELRPESSGRAREIVVADAVFFAAAGHLLKSTEAIKANWRWRRFSGKVLSIVRLAKAAFTFRGGVDYAAWKIARHSGKTIPVTDWNRRHPLLTGLLLLPKLLKKRALR